MLKILLIASVSLWLANRVECFRTQSVWVKGRLMCGTKPANGVLVKLIDADNGYYLFDFYA